MHLPEILAVENRAYQFPWTEAMFADSMRQQHLCYGTFDQGKLLAYCIAYIVIDECHILNVCVDPQYQRQGLAQDLLRFVLTKAKDLGALESFLEVRPSNIAAIQLYSRLGFDQVGLRKAYYPGVDRREDAWVFQLPLNDLKA